ncbi:MAG: DUF4352 domain-containing protein [archaeon YNP-LCB-003-016]|uniref:archaellin/type IV pilin N-terminal domain-containing protein n=1 Tax=Candidatus Culexarchaeum yellowstonense TaxID=2928963 RepID=UPI0026ECDFB2|nr:archaellin/type IV pilin N-terminal domain-containing protein [Candidatus Culexarchaeum yellowstonense]MCR6692717.1 DUF4352 domain-containing protein [Candidatus Culexarchaeum yellowstonense]
MRNTKKRGISPVIATVILVAIAIVISIAAAFWMTGLLSSFTSYEKLTLSATIAKTSTSEYTVTLVITNDGTVSAEVRAILINGVNCSTSFTPKPTVASPVIVSPGATQSFTATSTLFPTGVTITPGRPVKITVVTSRGSYETQLTAP